VRRLAVIGLFCGLLLVPSGAAGSFRRVDAGAGVSVALPAGWRLVHRSITDCSDPAQRLLATTARGSLGHRYHVPARAALVLLMEGSSGRFPVRPARFHLPRQLVGSLGGCCEIPTGPGVELLFRDHGRRFYAFVYLGERSAARQSTLALLNSLRISPRR
jgi:hypothetical protein